MRTAHTRLTTKPTSTVRWTLWAAQIGSVLANTEFNGTALFTGASASNITIQAGANASDTVTIAVGGLSTNTAITNVTGTPDSATFAQYDTAIALVSTTRAGLGASQNQLESRC